MRTDLGLTLLSLAGATAALAQPGPGLHEMEAWLHRDTPTSPSLIAPTSSRVSPLARPDTARPCRTIFGYLPYWESGQYLRYDLLTHLACFSVGANGNGTISNPHGWPWTSVINTAHASGVKVILVVTQFDPATIQTLIGTPANKAAFFTNIKAKILEGNADGVNIDFEGTSGTWRSQIHIFMGDLTAYLHAEIPGCEVTFAGPAVNWGSAWNLPALAASCDGIFIMGYAFAGSWSTASGPNAPLTGGSQNITRTVTVQYGAVTQTTPEKLILGLPYYGGHWTTQTSDPRSARVAWIGSTRFKDDEPASQNYELLWDSVSQTPWYRWNDGANWHQVWFDNAESLGLKFQLAETYNLQGVGMWALGYDGARTELWDELDRRFRVACPGLVPDFDGDQDVDQADFGRFQGCMSGDFIPQNDPQCEKARLDGDEDVDDADFSRFRNCFSGPGVPALRNCNP